MAVYSLICMRITWDFSESSQTRVSPWLIFPCLFHHTGILASQENQSTVFLVEQQILWSSHVNRE